MLTTAQLTTLRTAIFAETDPAFVVHREAGATGAMGDYINNTLTSTIVWRTSVKQDEIMMNGFDWSQVDNLTVGKARIWEWLFDNQQSVINPSKVNVRAGIDECWKGTAAMLAVRAAIYVHCKRAATWAEKLYLAGAGTDSAPATLVFEGRVSEYELVRAFYNDI